jgi:transposase
MGLKRTDGFRKDAVRIALTSGLTRKQVADDLGVGMSTLNKWITSHRDTDVVSKEDLGLAQENDRLRRENRILKEERDILNNRSELEPARLCAVETGAVTVLFRSGAHVKRPFVRRPRGFSSPMLNADDAGCRSR